jgi:histidinol-phosphate aminotransferase
MTILELIRPDLRDNSIYDVGNSDTITRLHANELPWSPLTELNTNLNHYPGNTKEQELRFLLAKNYQVEQQQLLITRGSDEALDLLMRLFLQPGIDSILQCPPTFSMYEFYAKLQQARVINSPLNSADFSYQLDAVQDAWEPNCKLIFLCTPNNPTGTSLSLNNLRDMCIAFQHRAMIVVDEAYIEFSKEQSAVTLIKEFDNLIVIRTLSKAYGLAALRLGCIITQEATINALTSIRAPYTLSEVVVNIARRALGQDLWYRNAIDTIIQERDILIMCLQDFSCIEKVYPSDANFLFVRSPCATELSKWLLTREIAIRIFKDVSLQNFFRITIGCPEQNKELLTAIRSYSMRVF